jgi:hypothetical protein
LQALARATLAAVDERRPAAVGRLTGLAYTLQNAEMRGRVRDVTRRSYDAGAEWLRAFDADELPMPPDQLVRVIHCLIEGLVMQRILTPGLCPDACSSRRSARSRSGSLQPRPVDPSGLQVCVSPDERAPVALADRPHEHREADGGRLRELRLPGLGEQGGEPDGVDADVFRAGASRSSCSRPPSGLLPRSCR